jgi:hypothetical protein
MFLSSTHQYSPSGTDLQGAFDELKPALASMPQNSRLLRSAVFLDLQLNDFRSAADHFSTLQETTADPRQIDSTGCIYFVVIGQPRSAMNHCKASAEADPANHTAHSNYGWAALDADEFNLALQEFTTARNLVGDGKIGQASSVDLVWGLLLSNWWTGNETEAKRLYDILASYGNRYTSISEIKKMPLVFSQSQLSRMQSAINKWHK